MKRSATPAILIVTGIYVAIGHALGFATFICGVNSGDFLFFLFYPCTFFWAFAYVLGPLWIIPGTAIAAVQMWMVWAAWMIWTVRKTVPKKN